MTATAVTAPAAARPRLLSAEALAVMERFPPRVVPAWWDATAADRFAVARRLLAPPFLAGDAGERHWRKVTLLKTLDWLELHQGTTWHERWKASGAEADGAGDWRDRMLSDLDDAGLLSARDMRLHARFGTGLVQLTCGDVIRPGLHWLLATSSPRRIAAEMGRVRDPAGITALNALREASTAGRGTFDLALERVAAIMAAKGGPVTAITPGDCIELLDCCRTVFARSTQATPFSPFFYELLSAAGAFPPGAPATVRMFSAKFAGPLTAEQMVDRYDVACRPVRDLLVDYLRERQPGIDYSSLNGLAITLGKRFWKDLEDHHPGISSLHLPSDVAAAWKQRIQTRTVRAPGGREQVIARQSASDALMIIRAFYLDLAQWALDDPARWGPWAVPCPIRATDIQYKKQKSRTKARMDARTRERLPVLPALIAAVDRERKDAAARLEAALATPPGQAFTAGGQQLRRARLAGSSPRAWAEDPATGKRRNLTREEDSAFWAWAAIEVLRHTGIRLEELTELSHHSLVQYRLPSTGELIPLLSIAPSKTDQERLLVIGPELADVLSTIITRVRSTGGTVPLAPAYDPHERTWTRRCPCCSSGASAWRTARSPAAASATSSARPSPPPASPAPTASPSTSSPTTSAGSSPPTPSSTACHPTSPSSSSATTTWTLTTSPQPSGPAPPASTLSKPAPPFSSPTARSCSAMTSPAGSSNTAPAKAPRWPPSTGTPRSPPSPVAAFPAPAANGASCSCPPASPTATPSASATPSPDSTTATLPDWSPRSGTHPENDQRTADANDYLIDTTYIRCSKGTIIVGGRLSASASSCKSTDSGSANTRTVDFTNSPTC